MKEKILNQIKEQGFITVDEFMKMCLFDEAEGYYRVRQPIGKEGDFVTAPEISQMFGEMIGVYIGNWVLDLGDCNDINIVELGAGRGVLMDDILRTLRNFPEIYNKIKVNIIDVNIELVKLQKDILAKHEIKKNWFQSIEEFSQSLSADPQSLNIIIANEFLDALPVRQFIYENGWKERVIKHNGKGFYFSSMEAEIPEYIRGVQARDEKIKEFSGDVVNEVVKISKIMKKGRSLFVCFDYGYIESGFGDTLQSLYKNKFNDVFEHMGKADLTTHVDFGLVRKVLEDEGISSISMQTQRDFLLGIGIEKRAANLASGKEGPKTRDIMTALERLTGEGKMGVLFKCLIAENI